MLRKWFYPAQRHETNQSQQTPDPEGRGPHFTSFLTQSVRCAPLTGVRVSRCSGAQVLRYVLTAADRCVCASPRYNAHAPLSLCKVPSETQSSRHTRRNLYTPFPPQGIDTRWQLGSAHSLRGSWRGNNAPWRLEHTACVQLKTREERSEQTLE